MVVVVVVVIVVTLVSNMRNSSIRNSSRLVAGECVWHFSILTISRLCGISAARIQSVQDTEFSLTQNHERKAITGLFTAV